MDEFTQHAIQQVQVGVEYQARLGGGKWKFGEQCWQQYHGQVDSRKTRARRKTVPSSWPWRRHVHFCVVDSGGRIARFTSAFKVTRPIEWLLLVLPVKDLVLQLFNFF